MQRRYEIGIAHGPKVKTVERSRQYGFNRIFEHAVARTEHGTPAEVIAELHKYDRQDMAGNWMLESAFRDALERV